MRRIIALLTKGMDEVPTKVQISDLKRLGVRVPLLLTRSAAKEIVDRELAVRNLKDLQLILAKKSEAREQQEKIAAMRKAYQGQEAEKRREAVSKSTELATIDEEELARLRRKYGADRRIGRGR